jgi:hypothetical protein
MPVFTSFNHAAQVETGLFSSLVNFAHLSGTCTQAPVRAQFLPVSD